LKVLLKTYPQTLSLNFILKSYLQTLSLNVTNKACPQDKLKSRIQNLPLNIILENNP